MSPKTQSISAIVLSIGLIGFSIYTINNFSKDPTNTTFTKIMIDILGIIFILGGIAGIYTGVTALKRG